MWRGPRPHHPPGINQPQDVWLRAMRLIDRRPKVIFPVIFAGILVTAAYLGVRNSDVATQEASVDEVTATYSLRHKPAAQVKSDNAGSLDAFSDSEYPRSSADSRQENLTFWPQTSPVEAYRHFIDDANNGDQKAQYYVSQSLRACRWLPENTAQIDAMSIQHDADQAVIQAVRERFERCQGLSTLLKGVDLNARYEAWINTSASQGFALAILQERFDSGATAPEDGTLELIYQVLAGTKDDPYLASQAIQFPGRYLAAHQAWRAEDREAWAYLSCRKAPDCQIEDYRTTYLAENFHDHEVESIVERALDLDAAVESSDWAALGLTR